MTPNNPLRAELAQARERVSGKTFAEAPELFKDIEGIKVKIWMGEHKDKREARHLI